MFGFEALLVPMLSKILEGALDFSLESLSKNAEMQKLRIIVRERLHREARMNNELLSFKRITDLDKVRAMDFEVLNFIMAQALPLSAFFDGKINDEVCKTLSSASGNYKNWSKGILTEKDLVERWYHRSKLAILRANHSTSVGDLGYLKKLCLGLKIMLEQERSDT